MAVPAGGGVPADEPVCAQLCEYGLLLHAVHHHDRFRAAVLNKTVVIVDGVAVWDNIAGLEAGNHSVNVTLPVAPLGKTTLIVAFSLKLMSSVMTVKL